VELSHVAYEVACLHLANQQTKEAIELHHIALRLLVKVREVVVVATNQPCLRARPPACQAKGPHDSNVLVDMCELAMLQFENKDFKAAAELYLQASVGYSKCAARWPLLLATNPPRRTMGPGHILVGTAVFNLGAALEALGTEQRAAQLPEFAAVLDKAEQRFSEALVIFETIAPRPVEMATCLRRLYQILWNRGKVRKQLLPRGG
jgi:hypothetical protein